MRSLQSFTAACVAAFIVVGAPCALTGSARGNAVTVTSQSASRIDAAVSRVLAETRAPGLALAVQGAGAPYIRGFGYVDASRKRMVSASTRFEIGSVTKQFTAAAIVQLAEAKKLSLDDRVGKFITNYPKAAQITLRQLLWQVSGLPNYTNVPDFAKVGPRKKAGFAAIVALVKNKPLNFKPGSRWEYSNTNYILLGRIVEMVSGVPYDQYIKSHIFDVAGMTQSGVIADEPRIQEMATGYYPFKSGVRPAPKLASGWAWSAGDIVSTAGDILKWDDAFFSGKIVSPQDVVVMLTPATLPNGSSTSYGFGWIIDKQFGRKRVWHNGGTFGFGAGNIVFPEEHLRIVLLINDVGVAPSSIATKVFEALYPEVAKSDEQTAPGEDATITARAKQWLHRLQSGDIDRSQLTKRMSDALTPTSVISLKQQLGGLGEPSSFIYKGKQLTSGETTYLYRLSFSALTATLSLTIDPLGKISGMYLRPE